MGKFIKNKKIIFLFLILFSLFLAIKIMAACSDFKDQASCEAHSEVCEWCKMPGGGPESGAQCYKRLETNWPPSPSGMTLSRCSTLPDFVRYFYEWGLAIGGIVTFIALLFSGVLYLTSVGKPELMKEARDRAISAFFGLILLFGSWLILNTINPELTSFRSGPLSLAGIQFFECATNADCIRTYGEDYECTTKKGECTKDDDCKKYGADYICNYGACFEKKGTCNKDEDCKKNYGTQYVCEDGGCFEKIGTCTRKQPEEEKEIVAVVFNDVDFNGNIKIAPLNESVEFKAKSVLTYHRVHKIPANATCETSCTQCDFEANPEEKCMERFNNDRSCFWYDGKCYSNCGENACGSILQLFAATSEWLGLVYKPCGDKIGDVNAYERNLVRWVDREINCVRLIIPTYKYGK
jgi:hypothetical protein